MKSKTFLEMQCGQLVFHVKIPSGFFFVFSVNEGDRKCLFHAHAFARVFPNYIKANSKANHKIRYVMRVMFHKSLNNLPSLEDMM